VALSRPAGDLHPLPTCGPFGMGPSGRHALQPGGTGGPAREERTASPPGSHGSADCPRRPGISPPPAVSPRSGSPATSTASRWRRPPGWRSPGRVSSATAAAGSPAGTTRGSCRSGLTGGRPPRTSGRWPNVSRSGGGCPPGGWGAAGLHLRRGGGGRPGHHRGLPPDGPGDRPAGHGGIGGQWTVHPKLVGERDGRPVYRITYSIRLPRGGRATWSGPGGSTWRPVRPAAVR